MGDWLVETDPDAEALTDGLSLGTGELEGVG
jgi:hypothetical protein